MPFYYDGELVSGPQGPAGPDGNPVGTIISFMGTSAPKDYLVCDGAEYSVSEYPVLAEFFREQFGEVNHFGGDGTATFAVPDMRNLFLRGYHGSTENQLSNEIGEKQEATSHPGIIGVQTSRDKAVFSYCSATPTSSGINSINEDSVLRPSRRWALLSADGLSPMDSGDSDGFKVSYTSRPVNMAVLYCIKAVESAPAENVYSTEETRIGTWVDGKPLYRRTSFFQDITIAYQTNKDVMDCSDMNVEEVIAISGVYKFDSDPRKWRLGGNYTDAFYREGYVLLYSFYNGTRVFSGFVSLEYTKTTD